MRIEDLGEGAEVEAMHEIRIDRPLRSEAVSFFPAEHTTTFEEWCELRGYDPVTRRYERNDPVFACLREAS